MKICCIQMDMELGNPEKNFEKAEVLVENAAKNGFDVCLLPETWNTGFFPKKDLTKLCDINCQKTKQIFGALAKKHSVNIIAGSVASLKNGKVYNTANVFNREGELVAEYDKTHLFTPMGEDSYFEKGDSLCSFSLDGFNCGIIICYDIRFPELTRTLTTKEKPLDFLFVVSQWPLVRAEHLETLTKARAIENQMFLACCNSCGTAGETVYGGGSVIYDPWGTGIAKASEKEEIIFAECDTSIISEIRNSINVFADRREELYNINSK